MSSPPRWTPPLSRDEAGYSLLEVMVALVVLSLGAMVVAGSMVTVLSATTRAGEQSRATALAVQKLESLKAELATEVDAETPQAIDAEGTPDPDGAYTRWVEVVDETSGASANTKEVTVVVEYRSGQGGEQLVELFTILYADDG